MPQENQNIEVRSEEVQEILSYIPSWMIRWGNTLFFSLIIILLFISWFIKYPDVITTKIMITTLNPPEKIFTNSEGKFDAILIKDRDLVDRNDNLAVIENSASYNDVFLLKKITDTLSVKKNNFFFPINELPPLILGSISSSFNEFENNYSEYILNKNLNPFKNQSSANQLSLTEAKVRLQILNSQKKLSLNELNLQKRDLERQKNLFKKGVISKQELEINEIKFLQSNKALKNLENSISQTRDLISTSNKILKGTSIEKTQLENRLLKKAFQSFYQLKNSIKNWEKTYLLKSSIKGKISFLSIWNKNQTVRKGDQIFTIIPIVKGYFIGKAKAPIRNSGKIKKGQRVQIQLANFPSDEYGELVGNVKSISLAPDQEENYLINVTLPKELITTYGKKIEFKQEMKGSAKIITEDLRLIDRFFLKIKKSLVN